MNRLQKLFSQKPTGVLSVFYTAGFPKRDDTIAIAKALQTYGADVMEIGIPFSDPVADGPVIQASNKAALDGGMTLALLIQQIKEIRKTVTLPIVLMGYFNPVLQYGVEKFVADASDAGVDGLIIPDLPLAEYEHHYRAIVEKAGLCFSFLISPTTGEERIRKIDSFSSGFVYAVSASSTTGTKAGFAEEQVAYFEKLKSLKLKNPFLIGFGISNASTFETACTYASGAIIGSAFINALQQPGTLEEKVSTFITTIRKK
jgi:tryptophan synthase alpha chain